MVPILLDIVIILLLVIVNGIFAFSELAVVSSNKVRLRQMAQSNGKAAQALQLAEEPTNFLSTVQVGITAVGILAGAFSGATLAEKIAPTLARVPFLDTYAEPVSFALVVVLVTYLSLIIGELLPKDIALSNPERAATAVAPIMHRLSTIALPIVKVLSWSTERLRRLLRIQVTESPPVTEEELKVLVAQGMEAGIFEPKEREMVVQALELDDITLRKLLTHRTEVEWLETTDSVAEIRETVMTTTHTWFPVCEGGLDHVVGVVETRDILVALAHPETPLDLRTIAHEPLFVPITLTPVAVVERFRNTEIQVAFAVDEYGGVEGIVTPLDILEALVGKLDP
ncbi:MAG: HlyC/CorC family transporter [Caldilineaceae bacterium]|nr:HlyC/CorC family transporter [Caldilineaceae bacterium]